MSYAATIKTPVGIFGIRIEAGRVCEVKRLKRVPSQRAEEDPLARKTLQQMEHYFRDGGFRFDLPLQLEGTEFQRSVWKELQRIKPGTVKSYGDIARILHSSPRAVGNACRANPVLSP
jgi:methylated-DNA-[protein]-cysteine S-methyltransferase